MPTTRVTCPTCATRLELAAEHLGGEVECGSCHQVFVAKADRPSRRPREDDEDEDDRPVRRSSARSRRIEDDDDEDYDRPRRRRRRSSNGGGSGAGTASLVLGLVAVLAWCCPLIGFPVTVIGFVLGIIGLKAEHKGPAIAGLVLNGIFFLFTLGNAIAGAAMNIAGWNNQFQPRNQNNNPWQPNNPPPPPPNPNMPPWMR